MALFVLLVSSLFFYGFWNPIYLILILVSMVFNFLIGTMINRSESGSTRKGLLIFGVLVNVLLLGYFKYYDFFFFNVN